MVHKSDLANLSVLLLLAGSVSAQQIPQTGVPIPSVSGGNFAPQAAKVAAKAEGAGTGVIAVPEDFSKLRIAPGFLLHMEVFDEPEMSADLRVDRAGNIAVPLIGEVHVADCSQAEVRASIESKFVSEQMLRHPQVTINVEQYSPFNIAVLGEVQSPGRIQLLAPHSLLDVLSMVGGETPLAGTDVEVRHGDGADATVSTYHYARGSDGRSIADALVHDGDTVIVPRSGIVYVLGAVNRPGGYLMQEDGKLNVSEALSLAMGTTLQAKVGAISVIRRKPDGSMLDFPVDYKAVVAGKRSPLRLEAQDIVYVPVNKMKAVLTGGGSIIGEATYATVYAAK